MTKQTYIFDGSMTAIDPLTVTIKDACTKDQHRLPRNGNMDSTPYWPATTIRGSLRHSGHKVAATYASRQTKDSKSPFTLADHFLIAQGIDITGDLIAAIKKDAETGVVDSGVRYREMNPMYSLFGFWGLPSKLSVGNAFPSSKDCIASFGGGARGIMFERDLNLLDDLNDTEFKRLEKIKHEQAMANVDIDAIKKEIREKKSKLKHADASEKKAIYADLDAMEKKIANRKDKKGEAKESIRRPIDGYEAITAGTEMSHRMKISSATQLELGFFLASLMHFSRDPVQGGHRHHHCGTTSASYTVKIWPESEREPKTIGSVSYDGEGFKITGSELEKAMKVWETAKNIDFRKPDFGKA